MQLYTQQTLFLSPAFVPLQDFLVVGAEEQAVTKPDVVSGHLHPVLSVHKGSAAQPLQAPVTSSQSSTGCRGRSGVVISVLWGVVFCYSSACETSVGN